MLAICSLTLMNLRPRGCVGFLDILESAGRRVFAGRGLHFFEKVVHVVTPDATVHVGETAKRPNVRETFRRAGIFFHLVTTHGK